MDRAALRRAASDLLLLLLFSLLLLLLLLFVLASVLFILFKVLSLVDLFLPRLWVWCVQAIQNLDMINKADQRCGFDYLEFLFLSSVNI